MTIKLLYKKYNWESYSVTRLLVEEFQRQANVIDSYGADFVISIGQNELSAIHSVYIEKSKTKVIQIGLSDPNLFNKNDAKYADIYFTNDMTLANEHFFEWLPCFTSEKYFYPESSVEKETDVLFLGLGDHPFIRNRINAVNKLREGGIDVKVFGNSWPKHPDNHPFISGPDMVDEIRKAKIMLDLCDSSSSLSCRIWQSSMCGTPVLTRHRPDTVSLFGDYCLYYSDFKSMHSQLLRNLQDPESLNKLGSEAIVLMLQRHTVSQRVKQVLREVGYAS